MKGTLRGAWKSDPPPGGPPDLPQDSIADTHRCPSLALIRQRHSLFRLAFDDRRVTRAMLRAQAVEFERWLSEGGNPGDR